MDATDVLAVDPALVLWPQNTSDAPRASANYQVVIQQDPTASHGWSIAWSFQDGTCYDGIRNIDETETDCGGICGPCQRDEPAQNCTDDAAGGHQSQTAAGQLACNYAMACDQLAEVFAVGINKLSKPDAQLPDLAGNCNSDVPLFLSSLQASEDQQLQVLFFADAADAPLSVPLLEISWPEEQMAAPNILLQGDPTMPVIYAQVLMPDGGNFMARYLQWQERPTDANRRNSTISATGYPCRISIHHCSFEGLAARQGGAIYMYAADAVLGVERSVFRGCSAMAGGAIFNDGAGEIFLNQVDFIRNYVFQTGQRELCPDGNCRLSGNGAAIFKDGGGNTFAPQGSMQTTNCTFVENRINVVKRLLDDGWLFGGTAMRLQSVQGVAGWRIRDTTFTPYDIVDTVSVTASGVMNCERHPCLSGEQCITHESSLSCMACDSSTVSEDGRDCHKCPPGQEPNDNSTLCTPCEGSSSLICMNASHCPPGKYADANNKCRCDDTSYDTEDAGTVLCVPGSFTEGILNAPGGTYQQAQRARASGHTCQPCPSVCSSCGSGKIHDLKAGWRLNATGPTDMARLLESGKGGQPQFIFRCLSTAACPSTPIQPTEDYNLTALGCPPHYSGRMCGYCSPGYTSSWDRVHCNRCTSGLFGSLESTTAFGMPIWLCLAVLLTVAAVISYVLWVFRLTVVRLKTELMTNLKILVGLFQILSLIPNVLGILFPPRPHAAMNTMGLVTADIRNLIQLSCFGIDWYSRWLVNVVVVPAVAFGLIAAWCLWQIFGRTNNWPQTRDRALSALCFSLMLLYPRLCHTIFEAFQCRQLGNSATVLSRDYSVSCDTPKYDQFYVAAVCLTFVIPIGFPALLLLTLLSRWRRAVLTHRDRTRASTELGSTSGQINPVDIMEDEAVMAMTEFDFAYQQIFPSFGFWVADFRCVVDPNPIILQSVPITSVIIIVSPGPNAFGSNRSTFYES